MGRKLTQEQFIEKAIEVHGDKYGYDRVVYIDSYTEVEIYCKNCNEYFKQISKTHLSGHGCRKCGISKRKKNQSKITTDDFITRSKKVHGNKYGYDKVIYINNHINVEIWCNIHKEYFNQTPNKHLNNCGCPKCGIIKQIKNSTKTTKQFIIEAKKKHGDKYGYDRVVYINVKINIIIYCKKHKKYFPQTPDSHLHGAGCPICRESKGEMEIRKYLEKYGIQYITQKRFSDCKNKRALPFDFYLPDYNLCIEFQGKQHYIPSRKIYNKIFTIEESKKLFKKQQKRDKIKRDYCKINNIPLLEIPYWNMKNIDTILTAFINTCN